MVVWSKVQTCIWPSWCHCHSLSLASEKSRLVLPFWYRLTWVVPEKGPLNGCMCMYVTLSNNLLTKGRQTNQHKYISFKTLIKKSVYLLVTHDVCLAIGKHRLYVNATHDVSFNVQLSFFSLTVACHCSQTQSASYTASNAASQHTRGLWKSHNTFNCHQTADVNCYQLKMKPHLHEKGKCGNIFSGTVNKLTITFGKFPQTLCIEIY